MDKRITAFISYSWDGREHEDWVVNLTNRLRSDGGGIDASVDKFELYDRTVNLNQMMIRAMRDYDYVIVVLTENYAKKADTFQGGVGFESELLLPDIRRNRDKIILIMRHQGNFEAVFPSHLRDYYAIDFSIDHQFEDKLMELIRRIYRANPYQKAPLGSVPNFNESSISTSQTDVPSILGDLKMPIFKKHTDLDKDEFIKSSFKQMKKLFGQLFEYVKSQNNNFSFVLDEEGSSSCQFKLYVDGKAKTGIRMWIDNSRYSSQSINLFYGIHSFSHGASNEIIYPEVKNGQLLLKMTMSFGNREETTSPETIVRFIWKEHLEHSLKM